MPRCFMAKKLKYPYEQWKVQQQQQELSRSSPTLVKEEEYEEEEIDVDDSSNNNNNNSKGYNNYHEIHSPPAAHAHLLAAHFGHYGFIHTAAVQHPQSAVPLPAHRSSSLTPPPEHPTRKNKDLFRPYCLDDPSPLHQSHVVRPPPFSSLYTATPSPYLHYRNIEDINTAHAILDLSRRSSSPPQNLSSSSRSSSSPAPSNLVTSSNSPSSSIPTPTSSTAATAVPVVIKKERSSNSNHTPSPLLSPALSTSSSSNSSAESQTFKVNQGKTTAYTYEAFFASDGRSKKGSPLLGSTVAEPQPQQNSKTRYTCTECGKNYATSSNLSRHKQTHRSLDSNNAKKCHICGKMYVSMPALSMHILTHNLNHKCDVCGKAFSRPWLLQGHMRSHSGDKPYGCAHCGKSFADRSNLRAHMQTHSAFKNFKCKRCNKSFALKSYLNKHYESACFKDEPIPSIDTPPSTPAPSELSDDLASPGAASSYSGEQPFSPTSSTTSSLSPPSITSLLTTLPRPSSTNHQIMQL